MVVESPPSFTVRLRRISGALLDLVVPRRCGLCGRFDTFLCDRCTASLPPASMPRCPTCWGPVDQRGACRSCAAELVPSLAGLRSPYLMDGGARQLVHALKYDGHSALAEPMGHLMAACLTAWSITPDVIVPVPLHPSRRRRRGFNQAATLARSISDTTGIAMDAALLHRTRNTVAQVQTAGAEERRRNVAGAFAVTRPITVRTALLVDDVCTTGATMRECAAALRASGVFRVYALTFAR
jgi:competence protein ComFC